MAMTLSTALVPKARFGYRPSPNIPLGPYPAQPGGPRIADMLMGGGGPVTAPLTSGATAVPTPAPYEATPMYMGARFPTSGPGSSGPRYDPRDPRYQYPAEIAPWPGIRGRYAQRQGLQNLLDILRSQGATDPRLFNQQLAAIMRGTESNVGGLEEQLAASGLSGSGVGNALIQASREAGANRVSGAYAQEAALQEQRKRQDLELLFRLLDLQTQRRGQDLGIGAQQTAENAARRGANAQALASLIGMIAAIAA